MSEETQWYRVFGPTCDSVDRLPPRFHLPIDLRDGDWIEFDQVGAYSSALTTSFNGFRSDRFVEVFDDPISMSPSGRNTFVESGARVEAPWGFVTSRIIGP